MSTREKDHLHALTLPFSILFMYLGIKHNFLHLNDTGGFFQSFITVFICFCAAFCVEWYQGVRGYNRTPEQHKRSWQDILVSVVASVIGVILYWLIPSFSLIIAGAFTIAILLIEVGRKK